MSSQDELPPLTPRQAAFVQEYLIDLNATKAAIRAGYAPSNAASYGSDLTKLPQVSLAIEVGKAQRETRTKMDRDQVLHEMSLLSNSRIDWFVIDNEGQVRLAAGAPEGAMGAVASIKKRITSTYNPATKETITKYDVELKLWDKPAPLKLMGRHVGLFPDKVELTGPGGGPIDVVTRIERLVVDPVQTTP